VLSTPVAVALVFGGTKHTGGVHEGLKAGALYLVTENVDAVHQRVQEAGGEVVASPQHTEFGAGAAATYDFTTRDPEGNLWTIGDYPGARHPL
jgi:predicted enzyme related to lactoylglutathione lyase